MLREKAEDLFHQHSRYKGPALENHNLRIAAFTMALGEAHAVELDEDLVFAIAYLHDIGLLAKGEEGANYLKRNWAFVEPRARRWGLEGEALRMIREAMLYNHSLRSLPGLSLGAEMVRLAVHVEHSLGTLLHGLDWETYRRVMMSHPRLDLTRVLVDFARMTVFEDGPGQLLPIFFPKWVMDPGG